MNKEEHEEYLLGIAENVGELLVKPDNINHFRERVRSFQEEVEAYWQAVEEGRQADDPVDKIVPEDILGRIFPSEDYSIFPSTKNIGVSVGRSYIRLAVIHDKLLSEPVKIIEHNYSGDDFWIDRIWSHLSYSSTKAEYETGDKLRKAINLALKSVKADLERATKDSPPATSADTGQGINRKTITVKKPLKPAELIAYQSYDKTAKSNPNLETDKDVYEWIAENGYDEYVLPTFATWRRHVGAGRTYHGTQKNTSRQGRLHSNSIVKHSQI